MEEYRVQLDAYSGPLDLMLYLVKRHEIDLNDIPIADLTDQYLKHLAVIEMIDVETAGEFLVMAATLLEIKSAMLLPRQAVDKDDTPGDDNILGGDPRFELVQQLLAYKRFKDAAFDLDDRRVQWASRYAHAPSRLGKADDQPDVQQREFDLDDVHILDLCEAFTNLLSSIGQGPDKHEVVYDETPLALHAEDIIDRLTRDGSMTLQQIFVGRANRSEMIGLFLATLELVRQRKVRIMQDKVAGQIKLDLPSELSPESPSQEQQATDEQQTPDWRDPQTGEIQYDWPSEEARLRAERRATMRLRRKFDSKKDAGDNDQDDTIIDLDEAPTTN